MKGTSRTACFFDHGAVIRPPNLAVRGCGIFTLVPPDREVARRVDFGEIFWPISGSCLFRFNDTEEIISPGMLWYYPPGSFHDYLPQESFHYCWLAISGRYARYFFEMLNIMPGANPTGLCPEKLFYTLGADIDGYLTRSQQITALNIAFRILTQSLLAPPSRPHQQTVMEEVRKRIDVEFVDPQLSINLLAQDFGMHRGSLSRAFHRMYGECISDYIVSLRLKQAQRLLQQSSSSIREIAAVSGFRSASYFTRFFTARCGISPTAFRAERKKIHPLKKIDE